MTQPAPGPAVDWRRAAYALLAVLAWSGLALSLYVNLTDTQYWPKVSDRFFYWISYFTILSNIVVAVVTTLLAVDPRRRSTWFDAVRMSSLIMITVTGLVYNIVLAPEAAAAGQAPTGLSAVSNNILHIFVPILTVLSYLAVDRRGRMDLPALLRSLLLPVAWLAYTMVRGAVVAWYPYPFLNVAAIGYLTTARNCTAVLVLGLLLGAGYLAYDRLSPVGRIHDQS